MKERTKRLCDSIIALSLAVSVLSSAAAIKTYSARLDIARPGVTAFAAEDETQEPTQEDATEPVVVYAKINGDKNNKTYPENGFTVTTGKTSVDIKSDLQIADPTTGGNEGEEFKGWALEEKGTPVGETIEVSKFTEKDDKILTLYPVWGEPAQKRGGGEEDGDGNEEGEEEQETELSDEDKIQLVVDAQTLIDEVRSKAEQATNESKKDNPSRETMERLLSGLDEKLKTAEANLKKAGKAKGYMKAGETLTLAKKELKAAQDAMAKIPTANDKGIVETMKTKLKAAKEAADIAKKAVEQNDVTEYDNNYNDATEAYYTALNSADRADDPAYVYAAVDAEMKAAESAMDAAQAAFNRNVYVATDPDTSLQYTMDQLNLQVTKLPENHKVYTTAANEYKEDNKFFHAFEVKWVTKSGNKEVVMDPSHGPYSVNVVLGSASVGSINESSCSLSLRNNDGSKSDDELFEPADYYVECNSNRYDLYFATATSGYYVFGGEYYPEGEIDEDGQVKKDGAYVAKDSSDTFKTQKQVEDSNLITIAKLAESAADYKAAAAALPSSAKPLAIYDITFNGTVLPGKQVKVKLTVDEALKGKKVSVYHMTGYNKKYTAEKLADANVPSSGDNAGVIEFYTSSFSPFAVTEYTPTSSSSTDTPSTGTTTNSPKTGEGSPLPFVLAAVGALAVAGGVIVWRKKKTAQD